MKNISQIMPGANASQTLRNIADQMDNGEIESDNVTIISGTEIFQCGEYSDERAEKNAIFNMTVGISKLMYAINSQID